MNKSVFSFFFFLPPYVTRNCFVLICTQLLKYFTGNIQKICENKRNISVKCRKYRRNKHLMEITFKHRYAYVWYPLFLINYKHSYRNIFIIIQLVVVFHLYCQSSAQQSNLSWEQARTVFSCFHGRSTVVTVESILHLPSAMLSKGNGTRTYSLETASLQQLQQRVWGE